MVVRKSAAPTMLAFIGAALLAAGIGLAALSYLTYRQNSPIAQLELPGTQLPSAPDVDIPDVPVPPRADS
jgi:hypothetical protein